MANQLDKPDLPFFCRLTLDNIQKRARERDRYTLVLLFVLKIIIKKVYKRTHIHHGEESIHRESCSASKKKRTSSQIIQRKKGTDINTRRLSESTKRFKKKEGERKAHFRNFFSLFFFLIAKR